MNTLSPMLSSGGFNADMTLAGKSEPEAAKQLESMFISLLLKEMRQSIGSENGFAGDSTDTVGGLFDQYLGDHVAAGGGLGIADSLRGTLIKESGT